MLHQSLGTFESGSVKETYNRFVSRPRCSRKDAHKSSICKAIYRRRRYASLHVRTIDNRRSENGFRHVVFALLAVTHWNQH